MIFTIPLTSRIWRSSRIWTLRTFIKLAASLVFRKRAQVIDLTCLTSVTCHSRVATVWRYTDRCTRARRRRTYNMPCMWPKVKQKWPTVTITMYTQMREESYSWDMAFTQSDNLIQKDGTRKPKANNYLKIFVFFRLF